LCLTAKKPEVEMPDAGVFCSPEFAQLRKIAAYPIDDQTTNAIARWAIPL